MTDIPCGMIGRKVERAEVVVEDGAGLGRLFLHADQRVLYWNKFGMPEFGFQRTQEWENAFSVWWVDPEKEKALRDARRNNASLPRPPLEIRYWEQHRDGLKQASAGTDR
jgi:hypothetical protein